MTNEQAILELAVAKDALESKYSNADSTVKAIKIAIEALWNQPQQNSRKPLLNTDRKYDKYYYPTAHLCPRCHHLIYPNINMYCNKCGQAIDWSEDD